MRGIPKELKTREDIYNVAMDLPPAQAKAWLATLNAAQVRSIITAEDLAILKSRVAWSRWRQEAAEQRKAGLDAELANIEEKIARLKKDQAALIRELAGIGQAIAGKHLIQALAAAKKAGEAAARLLDVVDATMADAAVNISRRADNLVEARRAVQKAVRSADDLQRRQAAAVKTLTRTAEEMPELETRRTTAVAKLQQVDVELIDLARCRLQLRTEKEKLGI